MLIVTHQATNQTNRRSPSSSGCLQPWLPWHPQITSGNNSAVSGFASKIPFIERIMHLLLSIYHSMQSHFRSPLPLSVLLLISPLPPPKSVLQPGYGVKFSPNLVRSDVLLPCIHLKWCLGRLNSQLVAALSNPTRSSEVPDTLTSLGIDIGAVSIFALLYFRENMLKNAQLDRLSREESLSNLKLRVDQNKIISVTSLRGIARLVICAGPASFIVESFKLSEPFTEKLLERGVLVVPFATDGNSPSLEFDDSEDMREITAKRKRLWQLTAVYMSEWSE